MRNKPIYTENGFITIYLEDDFAKGYFINLSDIISWRPVIPILIYKQYWVSMQNWVSLSILSLRRRSNKF